jgi:hypothetical protein
MNGPVRFAYANARLHALLNDLWDPARLRSALAAAGRVRVAATMTAVYTPLIRWYTTLIAACPPARDTLVAFVRIAELDNLKLLWRAAARGRPVPASCWRPLGPLARVFPSDASASVHALVARLAATPYATVADATERSHGRDLLAAELALEGWALSALHDAAARLPAGEEAGRGLVFAWLREREADLLRRASRSYGIEPAFAAGLTHVLRAECGRTALVALAAWNGDASPVALPVPPGLLRRAGRAEDWDSLLRGLRRARGQGCRRALIAYPYQVAPSIAAVLLREEQARAELTLAVAGRHPDARAAVAASPAVAVLGG